MGFEVLQNELEDGKTVFPWLIFKVDKNYFAVNGERASSIQLMPPNIREVPDSPAALRGLFSLRGEILSLLDLRAVLGYSAQEDEYQNFVAMLEQRKQDHLHWAEVLEECTESGETFPLATDPHQCAFGRWYDSFDTPINSVKHHIQKIEEPHRKLHEAANEIEACLEKRPDATDKCAKAILNHVKTDYVPVIVGILEEAKQVFRESFREEIVVLEDEDSRLGAVVDQVMAVEPLTDVKPISFGETGMGGYVAAVGTSKTVSGNVLLLDVEKLLHLFDEG